MKPFLSILLFVILENVLVVSQHLMRTLDAALIVTDITTFRYRAYLVLGISTAILCVVAANFYHRDHDSKSRESVFSLIVLVLFVALTLLFIPIQAMHHDIYIMPFYVFVNIGLPLLGWKLGKKFSKKPWG